jgi:hypothetical protein
MKEFMLLIRNQINHQESWLPEKHASFLKQCESYINALTKEGRLKSAQPLIRSGAMVTKSEGSWNSGAFNDTSEVIVGYYHVLAKDLDDAIAIAQRNPEFTHSTTARIEVRPIKTREESTGYVYPERP